MENFTAASCGALSPAFSAPTGPVIELGHPGAVVLQSAPLLVSLGTWLLMEAVHTRGTGTRRVRQASTAVGILAGLTASFLTWRVFDLLECGGQGEAHQWQIVAVAGSAATSALLLLVLARRTIRLPIAILFAIAGGAIFADWALRGGFLVTYASEPLASLQQLWCLQAVALFPFLPRRGDRRLRPRICVTRPSNERTLDVDSLHRRPDAATSGSAPARHARSWTWFL